MSWGPDSRAGSGAGREVCVRERVHGFGARRGLSRHSAERDRIRGGGGPEEATRESGCEVGRIRAVWGASVACDLRVHDATRVWNSEIRSRRRRRRMFRLGRSRARERRNRITCARRASRALSSSFQCSECKTPDPRSFREPHALRDRLRCAIGNLRLSVEAASGSTGWPFCREYSMSRLRPGVYQACGSEGYELCHPTSDAGFETVFDVYCGRLGASSWKPVEVEIIREDEGRSLVESDAPTIGCDPLIFRRRAVLALGDLLSSNGDLMPLECEAAKLVLFLPTHLVDALDEKASSLIRFDDQSIMMIQRHVFRPDVIRDLDVFRIPNMRGSPTFLSHRFVDRWQSRGLKGIDFEHVWSPSS